jgi:hypothetical protein
LRRAVAVASLGFAWLCATGLLWDVMQAVAWGRMFARYARTESAAVALADTLDAGRPCKLCRAVGAARETARHELPDSSAAERSAPRVLFLTEDNPALPPDATECSWPAALIPTPPGRTDKVPVPPPRA